MRRDLALDSEPLRRRRKRIWRLLGLSFGLIATGAFFTHAVRVLNQNDLTAIANANAITGIAILALASALIIPISALAWRRLLGDVGTNKSWSELGTIMGLTQFAKYLPGNLGHHVGRAGMSVQRGIPMSAVVTTVGVESALAVLAAAAVGIAGVLVSSPGIGLVNSSTLRAVSIIATLATLALVALPFAHKFMPLILARVPYLRHIKTGGWSIPRASSMGLAFMAYCANYAVLGAGLAAMSHLTQPGFPVDGILLTASFAISWIAGFLAPGAPAGLGVREGIMLAILSPGNPQAETLVLIISARIGTTAGDALCFLVSAFVNLAGKKTSGWLGRSESTTSRHEP